MDKKECPRCRKKKPYRAFSFHSRTKYYESACRLCCNKAAKRKRYGQQIKRKNGKINKYERARRLQRQYWIIEYLMDHPCKCGEYDPVVLDFDHVKGKKRFHISRALSLGYSTKTILKEIQKCVVRCSNCHRRVTAKRQGWLRLKIYNKLLKAGRN